MYCAITEVASSGALRAVQVGSGQTRNQFRNSSPNNFMYELSLDLANLTIYVIHDIVGTKTS